MSRGLDCDAGYLYFVSGFAGGLLRRCKEHSSLIFPQNEVEGEASLKEWSAHKP